MSVELSLATMEDITKELESRYKAFILTVEGETKNDSSQSTALFYYSGGLSTALGLCIRFRRSLMKLIRKDQI